MVGIDGSPSSLAALEWAARQAELTGSTLLVVTTWEWPLSFGLAAPAYHPAAGAENVSGEALARVREAHPTVLVRPLIAEGHPAPVLA